MQGQTCQSRCISLHVELSEAQARCMAAEAQNTKLRETLGRLREEAGRREEYIRELEGGKERMEREIRQRDEELKGLKGGKGLLKGDFGAASATLLELSVQPKPHIPHSHKDLVYASARKPVLDTRKRSLSAHSPPQRCVSRSSTKAAVQYTPSHGRVLRKVRKEDYTGHINVPRKSEVRGCWTARGP